MRSQTTPVVVAAVLMFGFLCWLLLQMAPHGPKEGALLVRLAIGLAAAVAAMALGAALGRATRRNRRS